ncbi:hypothetical protein K3G63_13580 [Hymenobacter sp. HSC-4F20]|uniref:hypothetical protein n=1 Tax=Hymenobacter sp. HSC-4F20 TaxID=2864135 RepID=UPI001C73CA34|nr:hypothetical protein [Hymenobacter sp. HSC-4F20]MBX0291475.1 hypothetical protein [Hymenobacter sp. HSC-4F20]
MENEYSPRLVFRYNFRWSLLQFWWQEINTSTLVPQVLNRLLRTVRRRRAQQLLLDLRKLPALDLSVQQWLQTTWLPRLRGCGLRRLALLLPTDTYNKMLVESMLWVSAHEHLPYEVQYFTELPAALDWLTDAEIATSESDWPRRKQQPLVLRVRRRSCAAGCLHA